MREEKEAISIFTGKIDRVSNLSKLLEQGSLVGSTSEDILQELARS